MGRKLLTWLAPLQPVRRSTALAAEADDELDVLVIGGRGQARRTRCPARFRQPT